MGERHQFQNFLCQDKECEIKNLDQDQDSY